MFRAGFWGTEKQIAVMSFEQKQKPNLLRTLTVLLSVSGAQVPSGGWKAAPAALLQWNLSNVSEAERVILF